MRFKKGDLVRYSWQEQYYYTAILLTDENETPFKMCFVDYPISRNLEGVINVSSKLSPSLEECLKKIN